MIPLLAVVHIRQDRGVRLRLWLPLLLLWLLLLPLAILIAPFVLLAAMIYAVNPFPIAIAAWNTLSATRGVRVDVRNPTAQVFIHVL
jgi:hypothetical protein